MLVTSAVTLLISVVTVTATVSFIAFSLISVVFITEDDSVDTWELLTTDEDSVELGELIECVVLDKFNNEVNDEEAKIVDIEAAVVLAVEFVISLCCSVTTGGTSADEVVDEELTAVVTDCTDEDSVDVIAATSVTSCVTLLTVDCVGLVTGVDT